MKDRGKWRLLIADVQPVMGFFWISIFALIACTERVHAQKVALVVGNSNYQVGRLENPLNDASAIKTRLTQSGYNVIFRTNLTKIAFDREVEGFTKLLPGAEAAVFFFAGHAAQIDGTNYLFTVDAQLGQGRHIDDIGNCSPLAGR